MDEKKFIKDYLERYNKSLFQYDISEKLIEMKELLLNVKNNNNKVISIDKIQNVTSNFFSINLQEMLSQRSSRPLASPRQIAMYLAKKLTTRSLPEIGRKFANRDHTTVIHAVKTIEKLSQDNSLMKKNIEEITSIILSD